MPYSSRRLAAAQRIQSEGWWNLIPGTTSETDNETAAVTGLPAFALTITLMSALWRAGKSHIYGVRWVARCVLASWTGAAMSCHGIPGGSHGDAHGNRYGTGDDDENDEEFYVAL
jgi:hypothetical protein